MSLEKIYDANSLFRAFLLAKQGTDWKSTVQRYEANLLLNILNTQREIKKWQYKPKPMYEFKLCERGHTRQIKAQNIADRVVQRSLNDNVLIPKVRPLLIYDNGASLKDKGLAFARKRFEMHLRKAYQEYGDDAYILLMDFTKYYDNIRHDKAIEDFSRVLDTDELEFLKLAFKEFEIDVSYMTDKEYQECINNVFDALKYSKIPQTLKTGEKYMRKSVGIGNQSSQITGIFYPYRIDNYCKTVKRIRYYGRYMDDTYVILPDKEAIKSLLAELKEQYREMGIFLNDKKTHIYKITSWLPWLKINYKLKPTGGLIRRVNGKTIARERRRVHKLHLLISSGKMSIEKAWQCYRSWRGTYRKYDSSQKLRKLDMMAEKLLGRSNENGRESKNQTRNHQPGMRSGFQPKRRW